ncbi:MAG: hypothetical protein R3C28_18225 [Pirellulaceae bacterium]
MNQQLRKAAILIAGLDRESADQLLEQMPEDRAEQIRRMIFSLESVSPSEESHTLLEFLRLTQPSHSTTSAESHRVPAKPDAAESEGTGKPHPPTHPFSDMLAQASNDFIVASLQNEHPQVIAYVLTFVASGRVATLVANLPGELQVDVLQRIVEIHRASEWAGQEVQQWIASQFSADQHRSSLASQLSPLLNSANQKARGEILEHLQLVDQLLAHRLDSEKP